MDNGTLINQTYKLFLILLVVTWLGFQCKPGDMNSAFDELDSSKSGRIHYKEFVQKLNLEPKV